MLVMTGDLALQQMAGDLLSSGKLGKKIFRAGVRVGAKVIAQRIKQTFPRKTGAAIKSVKVKAIKRNKDKIGVRISMYAESTSGKGGYPYPMGLEGGTKNQLPGARVKKAVKRVTVKGRSRQVTDDANSKAYNALAWHVQPQHNFADAFESSVGEAQQTVLDTFVAEMEKVSIR